MASRARPWLLALGILLLVILGIIVAVPFLVPVDLVRNRAIAAVHDATGRDLAIKGPVSLSMFPTFGISAKDVTLSNAPWAGQQPMASFASLELRVKVLPLLSGRVEVDKAVIQDPVINLQTDRQGRGNWQFTERAAQTRPQPVPAPAPQTAERPAGAKATKGPEITLGEVRLSNGRIVYTDGASGRSETLDAIDASIHLPDFDGPMAADGSLRWHDRKVGLTVRADNARALLQGTGSPMDVQLASDVLKLGFKGSAALAQPAKGEGDFNLDVPSVRDLAVWTGSQPNSLPPGGLGAMAMKARLVLAPQHVNLDGMKVSLDDIHGQGRLAVATSPRIALNGQLDVDRLDLNPYLPASAPQEAPQEKKAPAKGGGPGGSGPAGTGAWSDEPIDATALRGVDMDLALSTGGIAARKLETGPAALRLTLANGRLVADLSRMALYQGNAQGRISVDASGPALGVGANLKLADLEAEPLLAALTGHDFMTGKAAADTSLTSRGRSQRDLVSALAGSGRFGFTNGSIKGVDLAAMIKNVATAFRGGQVSTGTRTEFSELTGTYTVTSGMLKNPDLSLTSPLLRLTGDGTINLPDRTLDYRLVPVVEAGRGGQKAAGMSVPVLVRGPWDNLTYVPDLEAMAKGKLGAEAGKMLDRITGGKKGQQQSQTPQAPPRGGGLPFPIPIPGLGQ